MRVREARAQAPIKHQSLSEVCLRSVEHQTQYGKHFINSSHRNHSQIALQAIGWRFIELLFDHFEIAMILYKPMKTKIW